MTGLQSFCRRAILAIGVGGVLLTSTLLAQPARPSVEPAWRVVVLNNADFLLPASAIMDQALRETLTREAPRAVELIGESLDSFRHPHDLDDVLHSLFRKKY